MCLVAHYICFSNYNCGDSSIKTFQFPAVILQKKNVFKWQIILVKEEVVAIIKSETLRFEVINSFLQQWFYLV